MELVQPDFQYKDSYLEAMREFRAEGKKADFDFAEAEINFEAFVRKLRERAEGKHLKPGYIPETVYWLVDNDEYIGRLSIRHYLTEHLQHIGGHIGYDIRPSMRGRGYGNAILALGLTKAKELGIEKALLTCDETNLPSRKIIEKNGGALENKVPNPEGGPDKLRFWVDLSL